MTLVVTSRYDVPYDNLLKAHETRVRLEQGLPSAEAVAFMRQLDQDGALPPDDAPLLAWGQRVDYVPRALEALVGYLRGGATRTLDDLLDPELFKGEVVANIVRRVIDSLPPAFVMVLQGAAVAGQAATQPMLEYLLAPYLDVTLLPKLLERLVSSCFLSFNRAARTYSLHPYDRDDLLSRLPAGSSADLPDRFGDADADTPPFTRYVLHARMARYHREQRKPKAAWKTLDDLQPQLEEFKHRCALGDYDTAADILRDIDFNYLLLWGYADRVRALHERLQGKLRDKQLARISAGHLGIAYKDLGQVARAIEYYEQALAISRETKYRRGEGVWLGNLGNAYRDLGQVARAIEYYEQALAISRETKYRRNEGVWLGNLGVAYTP